MLENYTSELFADWYIDLKNKMRQTFKIKILKNTFVENLSKELPLYSALRKSLESTDLVLNFYQLIPERNKSIHFYFGKKTISSSSQWWMLPFMSHLRIWKIDRKCLKWQFNSKRQDLKHLSRS